MYSLFTRIFLSFWLVALLLGATLFIAERYFGEDAIRRESQSVEGHAATVSALLADGGMTSALRWTEAQARRDRTPLILLDQDGHPFADQRLPPPLREHLNEEQFTPGVHRVRPGMVIIVRPVPNAEPALYLATIVHLSRVAGVPLWARLAVAVLFSGLVSFVLAAVISRPIRRLRHAAQSFAGGDLSVRVPAKGHDEVAALSRDFNLMADRLRDLLEAHKRLLRDVSHELRSPLARLRVALELARKKQDPASVLDRIEREAERLEAMVTDVLTLSRIEAAIAHPHRQVVSLDSIVNAVVQDATFEAEAQHKSVTAEVAPAVEVIGDPVLLRSAVENVVRNAVRYTAQASTVNITLQSGSGAAVIQVRDHGEGVPAEALGKLFQPFSRVGEARDRASGGYGLGLAISRQAVESHGGTITASNAEGGGLEVTLRLPLAKGIGPLA